MASPREPARGGRISGLASSTSTRSSRGSSSSTTAQNDGFCAVKDRVGHELAHDELRVIRVECAEALEVIADSLPSDEWGGVLRCERQDEWRSVVHSSNETSPHSPAETPKF